MSRVDEDGTVHPTAEDPWDIFSQVHIAYCRECNVYALPAPKAPEQSCPTRLMDGRNEIRCWLTAGHEGDCK